MSNRDENQSLQLAFSLHRGGKFAEAGELYRKVIESNPRQAHALHSLGIIEAANGNLEDAARLMARSLSIETANVSFAQNYATVLCQIGDFKTANMICQKALQLDGKNAYLLYVSAGAFMKLSQLQDSLSTFDRLLAIEPKHVPGITERSAVLLALKKYDVALAAAERALALDPTYAQAQLNRAVAYDRLERDDEAFDSFQTALRLNPNLADAWLGLAIIFSRSKRYNDAIDAYDRGLAVRPDFVEAWFGRGNALVDVGQYNGALAAYQKALSFKSDLAEAWLGCGNVFYALKHYDEALNAYDKALATNPDLVGAWLGRGNIFSYLRSHDEAFAAYDRTLSLKPDLSEAWLGRGHTFFDLKCYDDALSSNQTALSLKPLLPEAWLGRGDILFELGRYDEAFAAYDKALSIKPDLQALEGARLHSKMHLCDWSNFGAERDHLVQAIHSGREAAEPFAFLSLSSSAADQFNCAKMWARKRYPSANTQSGETGSYTHDKIRIAYISADFREHPVASLIVGMLDRHDRSRFNVTGISIGPNDSSEIRSRLEASFDTFVDASAIGTDRLAQQIRAQEIDILIDLNGFTKGARTEILALRPAPVQVNYLGYPGTMGAEYIDYIIADTTLIPTRHRDAYTEKIVTLPHSYMPHDDRSRAVSHRRFGRMELGLPERGFVFCCFSQPYKINPDIFGLWMKLLKSVDNSVLWLSSHNPTAVTNLQKEASVSGVDPGRLVFATRLQSMADHLARHRLADLFLDTLPYNAHTTASDALWAGLPVLTQIGETFAGRVGAGLLTAIGLPELITLTREEFENRAIELARHPELLIAIRNKLAQNRRTRPLFNTELYTRGLESAFLKMIERYRNGLRPDHIEVVR